MSRIVWLSRHRSGLVALVLGGAIGCGGLVRAETDGGPGDFGSSSGGGSSSGESSSGGVVVGGSGSGGSHATSSSSSSSGAAVDSGGGGIQLGCSGGDCTGTKVCCASVSFANGLSVTSACAEGPCPSGDYQFCASSTECASGTTCGANPVGMGPDICSGGTSGGGGLFGGI
jgi:hypothetical protein